MKYMQYNLEDRTKRKHHLFRYIQGDINISFPVLFDFGYRYMMYHYYLMYKKENIGHMCLRLSKNNSLISKVHKRYQIELYQDYKYNQNLEAYNLWGTHNLIHLELVLKVNCKCNKYYQTYIKYRMGYYKRSNNLKIMWFRLGKHKFHQHYSNWNFEDRHTDQASHLILQQQMFLRMSRKYCLMSKQCNLKYCKKNSLIDKEQSQESKLNKYSVLNKIGNWVDYKRYNLS